MRIKWFFKVNRVVVCRNNKKKKKVHKRNIYFEDGRIKF